ncbi:MAG: MBL fold metallo-hydrolase [Treponema sp.]|nr:MBL fold metallo-hydrolase [Candidatus Treponema merdequi]
MNTNNIFTFENPSQSGINWFTPSTGVFLSPTNVGIVAVDSKKDKSLKEIYLIDSGPDRATAEKLYIALKKEFSKFEIKKIIDTHSHADHCGGNRFFKEVFPSLEICATQMEKSGIECTINQSAVAYGANPLPEYRIPYYEAEISKVDTVISHDEVFKLNDETEIKCIPLPGHYFDMVGVLCTSKGPVISNDSGISSGNGTVSVFFTADGIFTRGMLSRYWIPFVFDVGKFIESLSVIKNTESDFYVPSHGEIYTEIDALYELNMLSVLQNEDTILQALKDGPKTHEEILKYVADLNNIPMRLSQFMLIGSTLKSYITHLYETEKIKWHFKDNRMLWGLSSTSSSQ